MRLVEEIATLNKPQLAASDIPDIHTEVSYPKLMQPKLDGICCLAVNGLAYSRTMKLIPNKFIQNWFEKNHIHGTHGELMIAGDFNDVQSGVMRVEGEPDFYYVVYDMWDTPKAVYEVRLERIKAIGEDFDYFEPERFHVIHTDVVNNPEECETTLDQYIRAGYEGGMLRDPLSLYKQGRHTVKGQGLLKLKSFFDDEAVIIGFEEKMHNENEKTTDERGYSKRSSHKENLVPAGVLGALIVKWKDVEFKIGSGYTDGQRKHLWEIRESLLNKLVTFKAQELSKYGVPRFPVYKALRDEYNV